MAHTLPIYPSPSEIRRIRNACKSERDRRLVRLLEITGGRISEVLSLRWGDLTLHGLRMANLKQHTRAEKHVYLPEACVQEVRTWAKGEPAESFMFPGRFDGHLSRQMAWRIVKEAAAAAGVFVLRDDRLTCPWPHSYRHAAAVNMIEQGIGLNVIKAQLGHANLSSTSVYLEISDPDRQRSIEKVSFD